MAGAFDCWNDHKTRFDNVEVFDEQNEASLALSRCRIEAALVTDRSFIWPGTGQVQASRAGQKQRYVSIGQSYGLSRLRSLSGGAWRGVVVIRFMPKSTQRARQPWFPGVADKKRQARVIAEQ